MTLSDDELLDFDPKSAAHFDRNKALEALREQGDIYRPQLAAARWLDNWRESLVRSAGGPVGTASWHPEWVKGFEYALLEVAAHLRQGDFLPGGTNYEQEQRGTTG